MSTLETLLAEVLKADEPQRKAALAVLRGEVKGTLELLSREQVMARFSISKATFWRIMAACPEMNVISGATGQLVRCTDDSVRAAIGRYRGGTSRAA